MKELRTMLLVIVCTIGISALLAQTPQWDWAIGAGGTGLDQAQSLAVDEDGYQYITGHFYGYIAIGNCALTSNGYDDVFVAKLDPTGNCIWAVSAGGTTQDQGLEIALDSNGNVCVTGIYRGTASFGSTTLTSYGSSDIFVAKLDNAGNWLWARSAGGITSTPDIAPEQCNAIATDPDANVLISGYFIGPANFGPFDLTSYYSHEFQNFSRDMFVAKLDSNGNWLWAVASVSRGWAEGRSLISDNSGNACVIGHFGWQTTFGDDTLTSVNNGYDIFVSKLSPTGTFLWTVAPSGIGQDLGADIALGPANTMYITGSYKYPLSFGTIELSQQDVYRQLVAKLDSDGNWLWAVPLGGLNTQNDDAFIAVDDAGNAYMTGVFWGSAPFGDITMTSAGDYDTYAAKMDPLGNMEWALRAGGPGHDYGKGIGLDDLGKVRIAGFFFDNSVFGSTTLEGFGGYGSDIFVATVGGGVPVSDAVAPVGTASMLYPAWPNPVSRDSMVNLKVHVAERERGTLSVYNLRGQVLYSRDLSAGEQHFELNMADSAAGVYIYRLQAGDTDSVRRFVLIR
jgi:hypothetical protein